MFNERFNYARGSANRSVTLFATKASIRCASANLISMYVPLVTGAQLEAAQRDPQRGISF